ncbi:DinB family protein [Paenibacillus polymyxa]|uniref:DinB family protein n=1 Tax=Paenibacillus polymyxa TaxID=1406 RepID=A0A8I1LW45_PAEPO|nr:DinB family protein [Paenibacillus sp. EKM206P]KAF6587789.1 DinB family protein [Paenibacillus sp. EKM205P]MBM0634407.1 DinB family protein [Paenibacillus polymyxa]
MLSKVTYLKGGIQLATIAEISEDLEKWTVFLTALSPYSDELLRKPIVGTWSIQDMISHIMGWDKSFTKTLIQIINEEQITLQEHPDVQAFNDSSVEFGRNMKPHDLLNEAIAERRRMIVKLKMVSESMFIRQFPNSSYTMGNFLQEMFVQHDRHHKEQIMNSLQAMN